MSNERKKVKFIKIKNFYSTENIVRELRQPWFWRKYLQNKFDNVPVLKIYKQLLNLNNKQTTQFKNGQMI